MNIAHRFTAGVFAVMLALLTACAPTPTREGTGEYIDDALITSKVKAAFATDPAVKATEVQVETFRGTVQLSGFVSSPESVQRATELARKVAGVRAVKNDILVKPGAR